MISKERLEDLIKEGATIWCLYEDFAIKLNNQCSIKNNVLYWHKKDFYDNDWEFELDELYETLEEKEADCQLNWYDFN